MGKLLSIFLISSMFGLNSFAQQLSRLPIDELRIKSIIDKTKHWTAVPTEIFLRESEQWAPEEYQKLKESVNEARELGISPSLYAPVWIAHSKMAKKWQLESARRIFEE